MDRPATRGAAARPRLTRERVLSAAMGVADAGGIGSLTIRSLAAELGVKPMSVYHHVAGKEEILDGLVDLVFDQIALPSPEGSWREELGRRAHSTREVLGRHRWAIGLLESRTSPGPATLRHHDATLATLLAAGFTPAMTAHAYALLDSYVYGFALQEASLPFEGVDDMGEVAETVLRAMTPHAYPHLAEMATTYYLQPGYDFGEEFGFGLELVLDGLAQLLRTG